MSKHSPDLVQCRKQPGIGTVVCLPRQAMISADSRTAHSHRPFVRKGRWKVVSSPDRVPCPSCSPCDTSADADMWTYPARSATRTCDRPSSCGSATSATLARTAAGASSAAAEVSPMPALANRSGKGHADDCFLGPQVSRTRTTAP